jgi:hypothetical protein
MSKILSIRHTTDIICKYGKHKQTQDDFLYRNNPKLKLTVTLKGVIDESSLVVYIEIRKLDGSWHRVNLCIEVDGSKLTELTIRPRYPTTFVLWLSGNGEYPIYRLCCSRSGDENVYVRFFGWFNGDGKKLNRYRQYARMIFGEERDTLGMNDVEQALLNNSIAGPTTSTVSVMPKTPVRRAKSTPSTESTTKKRSRSDVSDQPASKRSRTQEHPASSDTIPFNLDMNGIMNQLSLQQNQNITNTSSVMSNSQITSFIPVPNQPIMLPDASQSDIIEYDIFDDTTILHSDNNLLVDYEYLFGNDQDEELEWFNFI